MASYVQSKEYLRGQLMHALARHIADQEPSRSQPYKELLPEDTLTKETPDGLVVQKLPAQFVKDSEILKGVSAKTKVQLKKHLDIRATEQEIKGNVNSQLAKFDYHLLSCHECKGVEPIGTLVCCSACPASFHKGCLPGRKFPMNYLQPISSTGCGNLWLCPECDALLFTDHEDSCGGEPTPQRASLPRGLTPALCAQGADAGVFRPIGAWRDARYARYKPGFAWYPAAVELEKAYCQKLMDRGIKIPKNLKPAGVAPKKKPTVQPGPTAAPLVTPEVPAVEPALRLGSLSAADSAQWASYLSELTPAVLSNDKRLVATGKLAVLKILKAAGAPKELVNKTIGQFKVLELQMLWRTSGPTLSC